jgi:Ca-activated chloride channel family protein
MPPRTRFLALALFLAACTHHRPPAGTLAVTVLDAADKSPLAGAIVTLSHAQGDVTETSVQTDANGLARFPVPAGAGYRLQVLMRDYAVYDSGAEIRVGSGAPLTLQVPMLPVLKEVVRVTGRTEAVDLQESYQTTFGSEFIEDLPVPGRFYQNVLTLAPGTDDSRDFKANVSGVSNADPVSGGFPDIVSRSSEPGFALAAEQATSTFGVDVDRASYALARRYLLEWGKRPPADAIRLEEMVNYFPYRYPDPPGRAAMAVYVDDGAAPWAPEHRLVRIGLQARRRDREKLPPSTLVFLVDVSGSMDEPDRLPLVRAALAALTEELRPQDRVALVTYADGAEVALPATAGDRKAEILDALDDLAAAGGTAGARGLELAYQVAEASRGRNDNTRVILATDGDFNVGPTSDGELVALIESYRSRRIALSVLGVGSGEDLKDHRMEIIADRGDGNYAYADTLLEARRALVEEMGATLTTVARDVKVQVTFDPAQVQAWRLLGYENRGLAKEAFEKDAEDRRRHGGRAHGDRLLRGGARDRRRRDRRFPGVDEGGGALATAAGRAERADPGAGGAGQGHLLPRFPVRLRGGRVRPPAARVPAPGDRVHRHRA